MNTDPRSSKGTQMTDSSRRWRTIALRFTMVAAIALLGVVAATTVTSAFAQDQPEPADIREEDVPEELADGLIPRGDVAEQLERPRHR